MTRALSFVLAASAALAVAVVAHAGRPQPRAPMAYACQAGPAIPIATGKAFTLDVGTGAMTDLGLPVIGGCSLAAAPAGRLFGAALANGGVVKFADLTTFPGTATGTGFAAGIGQGLSRDPVSGKFYLLTGGDSESHLYEVDPATGTTRFIGYTWGVGGEALAINSRGEGYTTKVYEWKTLYKVDLATGRVTAVGPLNEGLSGSHTEALCFDADDTLWMISGGTVGESTRLFTVDTTTGKATQVRLVQSSGWYIGLAILP